MNILFVPDVHGRTFWKMIEPYYKGFDHTIFCGDYLDPYPHERDVDQSPKGLLKNIDDILNLKRSCPDKVTLLIGNHDFHYILDRPVSSRFDHACHRAYNMYFNDNIELFDIAKLMDDCLFTHAGLAEEWASEYGVKSDSVIDDLENLYYDNTECYNDAGWIRGGIKPAGSPFWSDVREDKREDWFQVFGHTQVEKPLITDTYACLDCHQPFIINTLTHDILPLQEL